MFNSCYTKHHCVVGLLASLSYYMLAICEHVTQHVVCTVQNIYSMNVKATAYWSDIINLLSVTQTENFGGLISTYLSGKVWQIM